MMAGLNQEMVGQPECEASDKSVASINGIVNIQFFYVSKHINQLGNKNAIYFSCGTLLNSESS